jgi:protein SCO1/2
MSTRIRVSTRLLAGCAAACAVSLAGVAAAADTDPHALHHPGSIEAQPADPQGVSRSLSGYVVPALKVVRDDGKQVVLTDELNDGRPVVLNFVYTTCSGICPLASHVFSELQRALGPERDRVHLVSISIDPEEDTPKRLHAYAQKFGAGPEWQHYTGTVAASVAAQRAFDVYRGDKMGHTPVTFVRTTPGAPWVRFDGFATADMLLKELHGEPQLTVAAAPPRP